MLSSCQSLLCFLVATGTMMLLCPSLLLSTFKTLDLDAVKPSKFPAPSSTLPSPRHPPGLHHFAWEPCRPTPPSPSGPCCHLPTASNAIVIAAAPRNHAIRSAVNATGSPPPNCHRHAWEPHRPPSHHHHWVHTAQPSPPHPGTALFSQPSPPLGPRRPAITAAGSTLPGHHRRPVHVSPTSSTYSSSANLPLL
jgi:hypothetical protein